MAYEISFRKRILEALDEGKSMAEVSRLFNVSPGSIKKWRQKFAEGSLEDPVRQRNFKKIDPVKLKAYMEEHPDAYLYEIAEVFQCATSSVHEMLVKIGLRRKKKSTTYREKDQKKQTNF